jgi:hypothetical protein
MPSRLYFLVVKTGDCSKMPRFNVQRVSLLSVSDLRNLFFSTKMKYICHYEEDAKTYSLKNLGYEYKYRRMIS